MATLDRLASGAIHVRPERDRVCLCARTELDVEGLAELEDEAVALIDRGFEQVVIDLRQVVSLAPAAAAVLAAIDRHARIRGARLTVSVGPSESQRALLRAGLLDGLTVEPRGESVYFDWSR